MIGFKVVGDKRLVRNLKRLTGPQFLRAASKAAGKSMTPVSKAIRSNVHLTQPIPFTGQTGLSIAQQQKLLKKSIGKRTKRFGRGAGIFVVAGAGAAIRMKDLGLPTNTAHMVEYGTRFSRPQPFVRPALNVLHGATARMYAKELAAWIKTNARKR